MIHAIITSICHSSPTSGGARRAVTAATLSSSSWPLGVLQDRQKASPSPHFTRIRVLMRAAAERMSCCQLQLTIDGVDTPTDLAATCGFPDNLLFLWAPVSLKPQAQPLNSHPCWLEYFLFLGQLKLGTVKKDLIMTQNYPATQHKPSASTVCCTTWRQRLKVFQSKVWSSCLVFINSNAHRDTAATYWVMFATWIPPWVINKAQFYCIQLCWAVLYMLCILLCWMKFPFISLSWWYCGCCLQLHLRVALPSLCLCQ